MVKEFNPYPAIYTADQTISSSIYILRLMPEARVVFIVGITHTLVVERSYLIYYDAKVGSAAD